MERYAEVSLLAILQPICVCDFNLPVSHEKLQSNDRGDQGETSVRRDAVRATVLDTIASVQPAAVIAHLLGSVVTYETLWTAPNCKSTC